VQDPLERSNLLRTRSAPPSLVAVLDAAGTGREARAEIRTEEQKKLASLGYVGGVETGATDGPLPDPKDRVAEVVELFRLVDAVGTRPDPAAELRLVELIEDLGVHNESLSRIVANNLLLAGRSGAASRVLAPFSGSDQIETRILLGQAATTAGAFDEGERHFRAALAIDAEHAGAELGLGILFLTKGQAGQARTSLERALARDGSLAEGWNALAVIHASGKDWTPAIEAWRKAVEIDPALADAWYNLALAYEATGRPELAAEARRRFEGVTAAP
jgi:tetratricopeptide (TPR) repeat protein